MRILFERRMPKRGTRPFWMFYTCAQPYNCARISPISVPMPADGSTQLLSLGLSQADWLPPEKGADLSYRIYPCISSMDPENLSTCAGYSLLAEAGNWWNLISSKQMSDVWLTSLQSLCLSHCLSRRILIFIHKLAQLYLNEIEQQSPKTIRSDISLKGLFTRLTTDLEQGNLPKSFEKKAFSFLKKGRRSFKQDIWTNSLEYSGISKKSARSLHQREPYSICSDAVRYSLTPLRMTKSSVKLSPARRKGPSRA